MTLKKLIMKYFSMNLSWNILRFTKNNKKYWRIEVEWKIFAKNNLIIAMTFCAKSVICYLKVKVNHFEWPNFKLNKKIHKI